MNILLTLIISFLIIPRLYLPTLVRCIFLCYFPTFLLPNALMSSYHSKEDAFLIFFGHLSPFVLCLLSHKCISFFSCTNFIQMEYYFSIFHIFAASAAYTRLESLQYCFKPLFDGKLYITHFKPTSSKATSSPAIPHRFFCCLSLGNNLPFFVFFGHLAYRTSCCYSCRYYLSWLLKDNYIINSSSWGRESVQFTSVAQLCPTLCNPMNYSLPGLPVHHQFPEFTQTHVLWVADAIQPSHPLSSPSPPALNLSHHQDLFQWVNSSHEVAKVLGFQLQHQPFQWTPRTDLL